MVDWGDGTVEAYSSSITFLAHTYTTAGDKIIKMQGITRFYNGITGKLISVDDWGGIQWSSMCQMFDNAINLTSIPIVAPDLSHVTDMWAMFASTSVNQPLNDWDVSKVNDMFGMFRGAINFDQDISSWCVPLIPYKP